MKPKTLNTFYWISTVLLCLWLVADGLSGVLHVAAGKASLLQLGYPLYVLTILGLGKILGAVAIIQDKYRTIKEWAFAGFAISCVGAAASWVSIQGPAINIVMPIVFLLLMFVPYYFWKRRTTVAR